MGATDRRWVRHYCYCYFRLGKALPDASTGDRLLAGLWLISTAKDSLLELFRTDWNNSVEWPLPKKLDKLKISFEDIFPFGHELSKELSAASWSISYFNQPNLFIRIRPGKEQKVLSRIHALDLSHHQLSSNAIAFPAATQLQYLEGLNSDYVIQDYSSQQIASLLAKVNLAKSLRVWDCCAASGGKSILAYDHLNKVDLLATDVRKSMMPQLKNRLQEAGILGCKTAVIDLEQSLPSALHHAFDLVIADVPCTGSGTWGRTPEQLAYFEKEQIDFYSSRQRSILEHVLPSLNSGGYLLYSTCSVFQKENEGVVEWLVQSQKMKLVDASLFVGIAHGADTLYGALLQRY